MYSQMGLNLSEEPTNVFSISELNHEIRGVLEGPFNQIWLKGEISNFKAHSSGHFYFSLKDDKAQINAVMFRGLNSKLKFKPRDGMEVLVQGKITVYEPRGNYQVFCQMMEPMGDGALQLAYEQLKVQLQKEGLFNDEHKKALPVLPKHIGVVTSPTGAAIRDILNVLGRRFKGVKVTVIPALVQGDKAPTDVVQGIEQAQALEDIDVLIVGRGGGSLEDLWGFNDERVARAIFKCPIPVISAVGHEVDFTIADYVADLRAPTPSAAAELVVQNAQHLIERNELLEQKLVHSIQRRMSEFKNQIHHLGKRLADPRRKLQDYVMRCDELTQRLQLGLKRNLQHKKQPLNLLKVKLNNQIQILLEKDRADLSQSMALLDSLSPFKVVERGYSIVTQEKYGKKKVVKSTRSLNVGDHLYIQLAQGQVKTKVITLKQTNKKED